nr:hypothetical protein [uncultured Rhodoferax sp.]
MIKASDEISIDFSTSCTRDVAVAKLLGWMQGPIRRKYIQVNVDGISEDQLPYLPDLNDPIEVQLVELRMVAQQRLYEAFDADETLSTDETRKALGDAAAAVERHTKQIYLAAKYFRDIDDELAKQENAQLRIDFIATQSPADPYVTLSSLRIWAKSKYNITLFDGFSDPVEDGQPMVQLEEAPVGLEQLKSDIAKSTSRKAKFTEKNKSEVSLQVTFALLFEAFLVHVKAYGDDAQREKFLKGKDKENINAMAIAEHLEQIAAKANKNKLLPGQQRKSIVNRINDALQARNEELPIR